MKIKNETRTLYLTGFEIRGYATINMWGGGQGNIRMDAKRLKLKEFSKNNILGCINDGQFGCESIECAEIEIYKVFNNSYVEWCKDLHANSFQCNLYAHRGIICKT